MTFATRAATAAAALTLGLALAAPAAAESWDMPMAYADSNYHTQNGKLFAEAVGVCTGGDLTITVHGGGSLFKGNEIKRAVQTGQAPIGERLLSAHANENALFGIDSVPFLATSFEASDKLAAAAQEKFDALLDEQNLVLLYSVPWPPQGIYAKKPLEGVGDMAGLKFRAYNAATARLAELAGMTPVQIEAAELSQALATGVAESFVSSGSTGYDRKVWEHLTHFYDTQAWLPRNYVFANKDAFEALDAQTQNCLRSAGMLAGVAGTTRARELTNWYTSQLAANGMSVAPPSETLAADLRGIGETMAGEWAEAAGADGAAIIDAFKAN
ncbi:MAG: TRAP transporter substrate-binding protein [Pseudomonadota bacterium]